MLFTILYASLLSGCASKKFLPKQLTIISREINSGELIPNVQIQFIKNGFPQVESTTDRLGFLRIDLKRLDDSKRNKIDLGEYNILGTAVFETNNEKISDSIVIQPNNYLPIYTLYFNNPKAIASPVSKVADMHYHVSLKAQNYFGVNLYKQNIHREEIPGNLTWYQFYKGLKILYKGKWKKPYFGSIDWQKVDSGNAKELMKSQKLSTLLNENWVRPKGKNNSLKMYTQATKPHIREGQVYIAFNAMTPFEHMLANDGKKRFVSTNLKSGAPKKWLQRIGWKNDKVAISHWENFQSEFNLISKQDTTSNNLDWRFLYNGEELENNGDSIPFIVNVIEGSHILQHELFST